jgi:hypothetical protein
MVPSVAWAASASLAAMLPPTSTPFANLLTLEIADALVTLF